jgi:hypothetical protein
MSPKIGASIWTSVLPSVARFALRIVLDPLRIVLDPLRIIVDP